MKKQRVLHPLLTVTLLIVVFAQTRQLPAYVDHTVDPARHVMLNALPLTIRHAFTPLVMSETGSGYKDPLIPSDPTPPHDASSQQWPLGLTWSSAGPNGEPVTFTVFLEAEDLTPDVAQCSDITERICPVEALLPMTDYYWQVIAHLGDAVTAVGPVWMFSTIGINLAPYEPSNPNPRHGDFFQEVTLDLTWSGGDPNGDVVTYDVFVEAGVRPPVAKQCSDITDAICHLNDLLPLTTYYWRVIATDPDGLTVSGRVWEFTTRNDVGEPGQIVFIPAGEFPMGCDPAFNGGAECWYDELPLHTVWLDDYWIHLTEVTNESYAQFLNRHGGNSCGATDCVDLAATSIYRQDGAFVVVDGRESYPVSSVSWNGANDYCTGIGGQLPTEAQWEKAARGPTIRGYPWGDIGINCSYANYYVGSGVCFGQSTPVASFPLGVSPYGLFDMAGNVREWVDDWYADDYYAESPYTNPLGPAAGTQKILRGGYYNDQARDVRIANRVPADPATTSGAGIRCAFVTAP